MKKSYIKILIYNIILMSLFLLDARFNFLTLWYKAIIVFLSLFIFKYLLGFEKGNHRYVKEISINITIVFLVFIIILYFLGIPLGFVKNVISLKQIVVFIIPTVIIFILREILRYQIVTKSGTSKVALLTTFMMFFLLEITSNVNFTSLINNYKIFIFCVTVVIPAFVNNVVSMYISRNIGYKVNIIWQIPFYLYSLVLPIVPDVGIYIQSLIGSLYPVVIGFIVYDFLLKNKNNKHIDVKEYNILKVLSSSILIIVLCISIYFTTGFFKYQSIAIASGSMEPELHVGDIVIVNKKIEPSSIKVGEILVYEHNSKIIVHRIVDIEKVEKEFYFYTKGDANEAKDNYITFEKNIIGIVEYQIPIIGTPVVWINN